MPYYADLREYLGALDEHGKLCRLQQEMIKETQIAPLTGDFKNG